MARMQSLNASVIWGALRVTVNPFGNKRRHASARLILHRSFQPRQLNPNACRASEQPPTPFLGHTREPCRGRLPAVRPEQGDAGCEPLG